jgi:hypothetical protein
LKAAKFRLLTALEMQQLNSFWLPEKGEVIAEN